MFETPQLQSLSEYLRVVLPARRRELEQIGSTTKEVLGGFFEAFDQGAHAFAYEVMEQVEVHAPRDYSFSTNAMVTFAVGLFTGSYEDRFDIDKPFSILTPMLTTNAPFALSDKVVKTLNEIATIARARIEEEITASLAHPTNPCMSRSETFGPDDPFTVGWILELYSNTELAKHPDWLARAATVIERRLADPEVGACLDTPENRGSSHALTLVRTLQSLNRLKQLPGANAPTIRLEPVKRWFEEKIHLHLSYAAIPDSSFDAPELVFALEGLILCDPQAHGLDRLVKRIFEVLTEKQQHNPNLRPYRPVLSTRKGLALLPLTIEVFNSLLRTLERLGVEWLWSSAIGPVRPIVSRYVAWLLGQRTTVNTTDGKSICGWHSEHTHTDRLIHVWETSQVLLFLRHYASWIDAEIQKEILETGTFTISRPPVKDYQPKTAAEAEENEPDATVQLYRMIWDDYVTPRQNRGGRQPHYSMLLYGPPGTGKTTFPSYLAGLLAWPLITVTPSDFIVTGEQLVEERAKAIFAALEQLSQKVILFDEIDRLVLNRDTPLYTEQQDIFQFMTPSMLVKLANLRRTERCIFIISTNYEERIDPAIKRRGRIDDRVPVLPPDAVQRKRAITNILKDSHKMVVDGTDPEWSALLQSSELHTFVSLIDAVASIFRTGVPPQPLPALRSYFDAHPPDITLPGYGPRFNLKGASGPLPEIEFRRLYQRVADVGGLLDDVIVKKIAIALDLPRVP